MRSAVQADQAVLHGDGKLDYVDNTKNQLAEVAQAAMAEDVESEDIDTTEDTPENDPQSPSNGTLFEDDITTPNED
jgi:hypothetical protein